MHLCKRYIDEKEKKGNLSPQKMMFSVIKPN